MCDYAGMILKIRAAGMKDVGIVRWGAKRGRTFSMATVRAIVHRNSTRSGDGIKDTIKELYALLCS